MKTIKTAMAILIALTLVLSCTKKSNQTAKSGSSSTQTTSTTLNDVPTAEAALVGTWIYDSTVFYSSGTVTSVVKASPSNANDFQYTTKSSAYSGGQPNQKELDYVRSGQPGSVTYWLVEDRLASANLLFLNGGTTAYFNGYIRQLDAHTLVTSQLYGNSLQGQYFYLHK